MNKKVVVFLVVVVCMVCGAECYHVYDYFIYSGQRNSFLAKQKADHDSAMVQWWKNENQRLESIQEWNTTERIEDSTFKAKVKQKLNLQALWLMPDIPDLSSAQATLLFWIATTIVGALVATVIYLFKIILDFVKGILPLLSEVKTFLQLNVLK